MFNCFRVKPRRKAAPRRLVRIRAVSGGIGPRIMVGVDGSPSSLSALRWAVGQARLTGGTVDAVIAGQLPVMPQHYSWAPIYSVSQHCVHHARGPVLVVR
jgi:nucleotide-binding universal stress UspA family protein